MGSPRVTGALLVLVVGACAGTEPSELTVLDTSQRVLDSGDRIVLTAGTQGGYHTELLLTGEGLASGSATLDIDATGESDGRVLTYRLPLRLKADGDLTITDHPVRVILCPGPLPIGDSALHFRWLVTDRRGAQLDTALDLAPICPAGDQACPTVCASGSS
jgi:hypothetical protein